MTGEIWDSIQKRLRFNDDGSPFDGKVEKVVVKEAPVAAKEEKVQENGLECDICGFSAKSNAGLAVHKMSHKTEPPVEPDED